MTLREIGEGIHGWLETTVNTTQTQDLVDWPVGIALIAIVLGGLAVFIMASMAFGFFGFLIGVIREGSQADRRVAARRADIPSDPIERMEWANRTGRYAPPNEKGE